MKIIYKHSQWIIGVGLGIFLAVIAVALAPASKVSAAAAIPSGTYLTVDNDFYAYVGAGENLDFSFVKATDGGTAGDVDAVITTSRPGASDASCTVTAAAAVSSSCDLTDATASTAGIWKIHFAHTGVVDTYTWSIDVQSGVTDIPGRVWTEIYNMTQVGGTPPTGVDFSIWYQSELGYQYKADYTDYNGISSDFQANAFGLVVKSTPQGCIPLYKSVNRNATNFVTAPTNCSAAYKLFFEQPAASLPASATRWNSVTDWIKPPVATPTITDLGFAPTATGSRDGNIVFNLGNHDGAVNIYVDTNNNGVFTDPVDVEIPYSGTSGTISVPFDGKDGNGNTIPKSQPIRFKAAIEQVAEIHFLMTDVELRGGGIAVERLNGPAGGNHTIYWDDTSLADPDVNRCSFTAQRDGTAGIDSTGGVHDWDLTGCGAPNYGNFNNNINGSWGDGRVINDWAYASSNTFATYVLGAHTDAVLADTGQNTNLLLILSVVLIGLPAAAFLVVKKQVLN